MKKSLHIVLLLFVCIGAAAQSPAVWSERLAASLMAAHRDSFVYDHSKPAKWDYELGLYLKSLEQLWRHTGRGEYFHYIRRHMDFFIQNDGSIRTYGIEAFNIDHIAPGRPALLLWQQTRQEKYRIAAETLRAQLDKHPRTKEGGFWHKQRYPWQMWLDGLYMAQPFRAEYALMQNEKKEVYDDIVNQFVWMEKNARDAQTGLLYHAWDESRKQRWANKKTGRSPHFWGRAMGWYGMALVDVLEYFPQDHPRRNELVAILRRLADAIAKVQDPTAGTWYQVLDKAEEPGNYREASASAMFVYALAKGVRQGHLDARFAAVAQRGFEGMLKEFMVQDPDGSWHLDKVCSVAGLGGDPYRDGSFAYYISEPIRRDDIKGAAPFILAGLEIQQLNAPQHGKGQTVLLDRHFNNEYRNGQRYHYTWEDITDSGFSWWGRIFQGLGAKIASLDSAPTADNLRAANVYIIVDPDTRKETTAPNFVQPAHVEAIKNWVAGGGTLILLANDTSNCETFHFSKLASEFGIRFTNNSRNMVKNNEYEQGAIRVPPGNSVFPSVTKVFIKELSTLLVGPPAQTLVSAGQDHIMATARYGKGRVFALGDPWLYNEYVDGKRLPEEYQNFAAAQDLSRWLLAQPEPAQPEAVEVAFAVEKLRKALLLGERAALQQIVSDRLSYGHSSGKVESKAEFVEQLVSGRSVFASITISDQRIVVDGNTAVVRHILSADTADAGKMPGSIQLSVILVWTKVNGEWKLLARQAMRTGI